MRFLLFFRRLVEMMFFGVLISVASHLVLNIIHNVFVLVAIAGNIIFFWVIGRQLFHFYSEVPSLRAYYRLNLVPMLVYCGIAMGFAVLLGRINTAGSYPILEKIYRYLFFNFKTFNYTLGRKPLTGRVLSSIYYSAICIGYVAVFPILARIFDWLFPYNYYE